MVTAQPHLAVVVVVLQLLVLQEQEAVHLVRVVRDQQAVLVAAALHTAVAVGVVLVVVGLVQVVRVVVVQVLQAAQQLPVLPI